MLVVVFLLFMLQVRMIVNTVVPRVIVTMDLGVVSVLVAVLVLVVVFVRVAMRVFVRVFHVSMLVLMGMCVYVPMSVQMLMFVVAVHFLPSSRGMRYGYFYLLLLR